MSAALRAAIVRILVRSALIACSALAVTAFAIAARAIVPVASRGLVSELELRALLATDNLPALRSALGDQVGGTAGLIGRVIPDGEESGDLLTIAAYHGSRQIVSYLIGLGAPIDGVENEWGHAPLYLAAREGHGPVVRALLADGAHRSRPDHAGCTPLHVAAAFGRLGAVRVLIEAGVDVNEQSAHRDCSSECRPSRHHRSHPCS